jgi:hypothetical protein
VTDPRRTPMAVIAVGAIAAALLVLLAFNLGRSQAREAMSDC